MQRSGASPGWRIGEPPRRLPLGRGPSYPRMQQANHLLILNYPIPRTATESNPADRSLTAPGADGNQRMGDSLDAVAGFGSTERGPATAPMMYRSQRREEATRRN